VVLSSFHCSPRHLCLRCGANSAWVRDLGSDNGTLVNGAHIGWDPRLIEPDDVLMVADQLIRLGAAGPIDPLLRTAHNGTVLKLALHIDQEGSYFALPILADALEEAGCSDADLLGHCRQGAHHAEGCWVIDVILGRTSVTALGERPEGNTLRAII